MTEQVGTGDRFGDDDDDNGFKLSPQDRRILELNHQGLSAAKISNILKTEGMPLSKTSVGEHLKEMRLDPNNDVQVNYDGGGRSEAKKKEQRWYKIMEWLKNYAEQYKRRHGFKISLRTAFYDATDLHLVGEDEYNTFAAKAADARIGYVDQNGKLLLPQLPPDCFSDDSRKTYDNYDASEPDGMIEPGEIRDALEFVDRRIDELKRAPIYYSGKAPRGRDGRIGGYWYNQSEYVEVWQEKNDLMDAFKKILEDVYVRIRGNKGYSSFSFLYKATEELKEFIDNKGMNPEDVWILYCGDWDPSGENIDYYLQRRLRQLGLTGIHFVRVAVTPEQIDEYHLPLLPIGQKPGKKAPNPNMREFVRRYGQKATHLNAFFTEANLPIFKQIIVDAINEHWDEDIYNEMVEEYDVEADEPDELIREELIEKRQQMYARITESFGPGWYEGYPDAPDPDQEDNGSINEEENEDEGAQ